MLSKDSKYIHGQANLSVNSGYLRVQLPRTFFGGKQKFIYLGLDDTLENREKAQRIIAKINQDIDFGDFDYTLARYKNKSKKATHLQSVPKIELSIQELWEEYLEYLKPIRKPTSLYHLEANISDKIKLCPFKSPDQALEIRSWLLNQTTESMAKRVLTQLNACCDWAIKRKKLDSTISPFLGMAKELKHHYEQEKTPNAFTLAERDLVIAAFRDYRSSYAFYHKLTPFVQFLFYTGCRPSEAVGLHWQDIDPDLRWIIFNGGVYTTSGGKFISSRGKGGKANNKTRKFPCNERLRELLSSILRTHDLVFPSPKKGNFINYHNFSGNIWHKLVDPIKPNTTPYSCRDTFITEQIAKGVSLGIIAKWVDNSVTTIEKYYLDMEAIEHILPL